VSTILGNEFIFIPLFAIAVFTCVYMGSDRLLGFLATKSAASREEVEKTLDSMFVEVHQRRLGWLLFFTSYGMGILMFALAWPNVIFGLILGLIATACGWQAPRLVVRTLWERRCVQLTNQMVDGLTIMGNGIKAGLTVNQSLERVLDNMSGPITQEFRLVLNKIRLGMSLEEALNEFGDRIPKQDVQMFVTAINILKETGGNLAETFATIVITIRERQKVEKKIQAMTARGTVQAIIIMSVPFVLMIVMALLSPDYIRPLFTRPLGWFFLMLMMALQVIGGVVMKKIVTIKV
jgi:tight adherence protein B